MKDDFDFFGNSADGYAHYLQACRENKIHRKSARGGGCLLMLLSVIGISAGFVTCIVSML